MPQATAVKTTTLGWVATGLMSLALGAMPLYVIRPRFGPLPTTALELLLLLALVVGAVAFWSDIPWRNPYFWPGMVLLLGATLGVIFTASTHTKALGIWRAYFVEPMAAGLLIAAISRSGDRARALLGGLALAGLISAVANLGTDVSHLVAGTFKTVTPPVAIYNSANDVPLFLEPLTALALALALFGEGRSMRLAAALLYLLFALAIVVSLSRGGWLALGALTVFVFLFHPWRVRVVAALVALAVILMAVSGKVRHRVLVEFNFRSPDNTIALRGSLWRSSLDMLVHRPLTGGGLSGFQAALGPYRAPDYHENLIYPHDIVLNFWSETGLVGLAGFVWLAVRVVRQVARGLAASGLARALAIGTGAAMLAVLLHGLVDVPYFKNDLALCFWAVLGIQYGSWLGDR